MTVFLRWGMWFPGVVLIGNGTGQTLVVAAVVALVAAAAAVVVGGWMYCARM